MQHGDVRKLISVIYVLSILFLGSIYFQDTIVTDPEATATLQNIGYSVNEAQALPLISSLQLTNGSMMLVFVSITLFFAFAWRMARTRSY